LFGELKKVTVMENNTLSQKGSVTDAVSGSPNRPFNRKMRRMITRFSRDEDGVITIFAVYMLLLIVAIGGFGVNLMHNEMVRTKVQSTLDRAILAAADLEQTLPADEVVEDYFAKAGMSQYLEGVQVTPGPALPTTYFRIVKATARTETPFLYMPWDYYRGITRTLPVVASGQAEEVINNVEISLVLDVSGSMNSNSRLYNLKIAAKEFVDQMLDNSRDDRLSISIIPYATQVSMPDEMIAEFNVQGTNPYSNCINFSGSDFNDRAVSTTASFQRTMHFDPWNRNDGRDDDPVNLVSSPVCEDRDSREILMLTDDRQKLKDYIDDLSARGNTSIDIGMKWGTALLDPAMAPVVDAMIAAGEVPDRFDLRPFAYDDQETLKVVVLMTDGQNTSQYYIENDHRSGESDVYWNERNEEYSIWNKRNGDSNDGLFYWVDDDRWRDHPKGNGHWDCGKEGLRGYPDDFDGDGIENEYFCYVVPNQDDNESGTAVNLSYPELWAYTSIRYNTEQNYYPWMNDSQARSQWRYGVYDTVGSGTKDNRTKAICDAAKAERIVVYTIGFEAPSGGVSVLKDCASSPSHFFDVDGLEISNAFRSIAQQITQLRLTQ
jgi:Flp pilus assembly protein TadG